MSQRDIERLRALEKAVELVAKATKGPWAFMNEKFDDCLLAFGTDSLECDAPPPWYSCWTSINPDDGRALIAAVNFIREHGSAILATASEQAPVAWGVEVDGGFDYVSTVETTVENEACKYGSKASIRIVPLYTSPAHTSEARDAGPFYAACERACAELPAGWEIRVCLEKDSGTVELCSPDGFSEYMDVDADDRLTAEVNAAVDAAMRQEAGSRE